MSESRLSASRSEEYMLDDERFRRKELELTSLSGSLCTMFSNRRFPEDEERSTEPEAL